MRINADTGLVFIGCLPSLADVVSDLPPGQIYHCVSCEPYISFGVECLLEVISQLAVAAKTKHDEHRTVP